ncbi:MAG: ParB N-terminal domain-containing protein [Leptospiraceae bacterium]|nr:ParB N-terminal domain-containing protein [Leptospiraceae bacterium]
MKDKDKILFGKIEDEYKMIPFDKINKITQYTDEKDYDKSNIDSLKEKIKKYGFDKAFPLTVDRSTEKGFFNVVSGNHRFVALEELVKEGILKKDYPVPVILKGFENYQERLIYQVGENQRRIPLPTDEGKAYRQLFDSGMKIEDIAEKFGQRKNTIETRLYLTFLAPDLFKLIGKDIPVTIASAIGKSSLVNGKPDYNLQIDLFKWYQDNKNQYGEPHHIESRARELGSVSFDFFNDNSSLTDSQKIGLAEVGSEEEAKRIIDRFKKTFDSIQKSYQKLFGKSIAELSPTLIKKLSGAFAYTNDNYLEKLNIILQDLKQVKALIEDRIKDLKSKTEIPIVFSPSLEKKIENLDSNLCELKLEKPKEPEKNSSFQFVSEDISKKEKKTKSDNLQSKMFDMKSEKYVDKNFKPKYKYDLISYSIENLITSIKNCLLQNGLDEKAKEFINSSYQINNLIQLEILWKKYIVFPNNEYNKLLKDKNKAYIESNQRGLFV